MVAVWSRLGNKIERITVVNFKHEEEINNYKNFITTFKMLKNMTNHANNFSAYIDTIAGENKVLDTKQ